MACDRCGAEPDADMTRYVAYEGDDEVHWTNLLGVPGDLADGNDADTTYTASNSV
mgnify:CR=1 FL=1